MEIKILADDVQAFIDSKLEGNIATLALGKNPFAEIEFKLLINQISAKRKAREKLPTWFHSSKIYYPEKVSIEQTSSEATAKYKSALISGKSLIDLSGGFGVDAFFFAKTIEQVTHCELNAGLSEIVSHNFSVLNVGNIECLTGDSNLILEKLNRKWDWIYVDPSRRHDVKGKVFLLTDCVPNVPELLDRYFLFSDHVMIKTSPLFDLSAGLSELKHVKHIHIVALQNEVKELLWIVENGFEGNHLITATNITTNGNEVFTFDPSEESLATYSKPETYLYEPNAAILKSGGFAKVSDKYQLQKLHQHSHLYTSERLVEFPGRRFKIEQVVNYNKTEMRNLVGQKMNITVRNFSETVDELRKRWKLSDGGNCYSFFTTDVDNNKLVLLCTKI